MPEPTTSSEPSKVNLGEGVARLPATDTPEVVVEPEVKEELDEAGQSKWRDTPTFADQMRSHPKTCRRLAPQMRVFNLKNEEDLKAFNQLLKDSHPPEAPKYILQTQEQTFEGSWCILARFQQVQYKILLSTK
jgi:hypothetical protein